MLDFISSMQNSTPTVLSGSFNQVTSFTVLDSVQLVKYEPLPAPYSIF